MNDREYVESKWERVIVCDGSYRHYRKGTILLNWANHQFYEFTDYGDAAAFTRIREKQIAEKKEEIAVITADASESWECVPAQTVYLRILASLEAVLLDLQRGMK